MIEKATIAALGTLASFRATFLAVAGTSFVLSAAAIFLLVQPRSLIRSAVEVGTVLWNTKEEPVESPDLLAKRIQAVHVPAALTALGKSGVPQSTLAALQSSSADAVGQTLSIQSTVDPAIAEEAKAFQQKIIDRIIEEENKRIDLLREAAAARTVLLKQTSDGVDQQIADHEKRLSRLGELLLSAEGSLHDTEVKRAATQPDGDNKTSANVDGVRAEITGRLELLTALNQDSTQSSRDLTVLRARHDTLALALLGAQSAAKAIQNARVTLAPEVMPQPVGPKRLSLLFIAAIASILVAFGAIAFLHSFVVARI
ncbi:hypothetical protein [Bradyrhizobium manausense]|uniref:Polysaccharide chain length determinant N-terminal domain-containing protein n=1 Tax=Bradyrhizobium manausense TaxID=989370 RepID=A0A0R3DSZ1_9BRAD|nr:hypothetical protein [Bradyrhizobium manausense]KRQ10127.1 hypothetical protein AOQ71_19330 [Bradyrhizobium manausense]